MPLRVMQSGKPFLERSARTRPDSLFRHTAQGHNGLTEDQVQIHHCTQTGGTFGLAYTTERARFFTD